MLINWLKEAKKKLLEAEELAQKFKQDNAAARLWLSNNLVEWRHDDDIVEIIARGNLWLEYHKEDTRYKRLPIILSVLALIISIVGVVSQWLLRVL